MAQLDSVLACLRSYSWDWILTAHGSSIPSFSPCAFQLVFFLTATAASVLIVYPVITLWEDPCSCPYWFSSFRRLVSFPAPRCSRIPCEFRRWILRQRDSGRQGRNSSKSPKTWWFSDLDVQGWGVWNIGENTRAVAAGALTSHLLKCIDLIVFADVNPTVVLLGCNGSFWIHLVAVPLVAEVA